MFCYSVHLIHTQSGCFNTTLDSFGVNPRHLQCNHTLHLLHSRTQQMSHGSSSSPSSSELLQSAPSKYLTCLCTTGFSGNVGFLAQLLLMQVLLISPFKSETMLEECFTGLDKEEHFHLCLMIQSTQQPCVPTLSSFQLHFPKCVFCKCC